MVNLIYFTYKNNMTSHLGYFHYSNNLAHSVIIKYNFTSSRGSRICDNIPEIPWPNQSCYR